MAAIRRKGPDSIDNQLGDIPDHTKLRVDRAEEVGGATRRVADSPGRSLYEPDEEMASLKAALDDLTTKLNRLADLQAEGGKPR